MRNYRVICVLFSCMVASGFNCIDARLLDLCFAALVFGTAIVTLVF